MLNKKIQVKNGKEIYQLWYNTYAVVEISSAYGVDKTDILQKLQEKMQDNFMVIIADLFFYGYKGQKLATNQVVDLTREEVSRIVATSDIGDLMNIWKVFTEHMGANESRAEKADKKKAGKKKK